MQGSVIHHLRANYLLFQIFVAGGAVLLVEIVGTRILGPFYGVSLYLWSALITVALLALSIGYALGGWYADRNSSPNRFFSLILVAGIWILLIPWIRDPIVNLVTGMGLRTAVLLSALALFAVPLGLLAMVGPFAIRLRVQELSDIGRTAGLVSCISTLGGVLSAILTGYYLIPQVGVARLTAATGLILVITSAIGLVLFRGMKALASTITLCILVLTLYVFTPIEYDVNEPGVVHIQQTQYTEVKVKDIDKGRYLYIDNATHSGMNLENGETLLPYLIPMSMTRLYFEKPGRALMIGLGGGVLATEFHHAGWHIDVVEIDSVLPEIAKQYFSLPIPDEQIFIEDGRAFLTRTNNTYDIILFDVYGSGDMPFHLVTQEVFALVKERLHEGGIFAINILTLNRDHPIFHSIASTLQPLFKHQLALSFAEQNELQNIILFSSNRSEAFELKKQPAWRYYTYVGNYASRAWKNRWIPPKGKGQILTDDLNPVDIWSEEINYSWHTKNI